MDKAFGLQVPLHRLEARESDKLPVYLRGAYDFWIGRMLNYKVIFAEVKVTDELSPSRLKKQSKDLSNMLHHPVVFVFKKLESWNRGRLIEQNVSFIEPGRQLYIPELLLHLNDSSGRNSNHLNIKERLSMPSQAIVLYKLNTKAMEPLEYQQVANAMGVSLMTVSRSMRELAAAELVRIEEGKPNLVYFKFHGKDLWNHALPLLSSPVKTVWRSEIAFNNTLDMKAAGETALSHLTMLSNGIGDTYALSKIMFPILKKKDPVLQHLQQNYGNYFLQVWEYNPDYTANNYGGDVDRLSLYLSMKDNIEDERMAAALEELLNKMEW